MKTEQLTDAKVGDKIVVKYYNGTLCRAIVTLIRETQLYFFAYHKAVLLKFRKRDGSLVSHDGGAVTVSDEERREIMLGGDRQNNLGFLKQFEWKKLPDSTLLEIRSIVERVCNKARQP